MCNFLEVFLVDREYKIVQVVSVHYARNFAASTQCLDCLFVANSSGITFNKKCFHVVLFKNVLLSLEFPDPIAPKKMPFCNCGRKDNFFYAIDKI